MVASIIWSKDLTTSIEENMHTIHTIYLHIGTMKTATSSIQDTLHAESNNQLLNQVQYHYLSSIGSNQSTKFQRLFRSDELNSDTSLKLGLSKEDLKNLNNETTDAITNEVANINSSKLIMSAETMSFLNKNEFMNVKQTFEKIIPGSQIKIVLCCRNPIKYYSSLLSQSIKKYGLMQDFHQSLNYEELYENITEIFGKENIITYAFEESLSSKFGTVGYFCKKVGIPDDFICKLDIKKSNERVSAVTCDLLKNISSVLPTIKRDGSLSPGRFHLDHHDLEFLPGDSAKFTKVEVLSNFNEKTVKENIQWFNDHFNIKCDFNDISAEEQVMVYDANFEKSLKEIYVYITPVLKKLIYSYILKKISDFKLDQESIIILEQLKKWMENKYGYILGESLSDIVAKQEKDKSFDEACSQRLLVEIKNNVVKTDPFFHISKFLSSYDMNEAKEFFLDKYNSQLFNEDDKKIFNKLSKKFRADKIRLANFLRDLSGYLESYGLEDERLFFLHKAKMYNPRLIKTT